MPVQKLQEQLGYSFRDSGLLLRALTHPSFLQEGHLEKNESNQRLEFLGDAILQHILAEALYDEFPDAREGELSKYRSTLAKGSRLAQLALQLHLDRHLRLGVGEEQTGGRQRPAALEDAFEALVGALYLDSDYATSRRLVLKLYGPLREQLHQLHPDENPKGRLQEHVQQTRQAAAAIRYETRHVAGDDHEREYESVLHIDGEKISTGRGSSKKSAEEEAARAALGKLEIR